MASEERLRELEEKYEGYTVYDNRGSKIGKVDDLFVDEEDHEEYIGVKMGFFGMRSTLIPTEIVRIDEGERTIAVSESKDHVKDAPSFDDDEDVTSEYEERIRRHFGLESLQSGSDRGSYGTTSAGTAAGYDDSDHDEGRETGSSGYAPGGDRESSDPYTRDDAHAGDREAYSQTETHPEDREARSGADTEHWERQDSGAAAAGYEPSEGPTDAEHSEQAGGSTDYSGERHETSESSETSGISGESSSGSRPSTSRQTEETETFQEGGRTKIRRRTIREEVVDAEDSDARP